MSTDWTQMGPETAASSIPAPAPAPDLPIPPVLLPTLPVPTPPLQVPAPPVPLPSATPPPLPALPLPSPVVSVDPTVQAPVSGNGVDVIGSGAGANSAAGWCKRVGLGTKAECSAP
jgi:hypothetical protein